MSKVKPPHPKTLRPDVTYPSPDPTKEPRSHEFQKGDKIIIKPDTYFEGYALGGCVGTIKDADSYILAELLVVNPESKLPESKVFKLLRYEVEIISDDAGFQTTLSSWVDRRKK